MLCRILPTSFQVSTIIFWLHRYFPLGKVAVKTQVLTCIEYLLTITINVGVFMQDYFTMFFHVTEQCERRITPQLVFETMYCNLVLYRRCSQRCRRSGRRSSGTGAGAAASRSPSSARSLRARTRCICRYFLQILWTVPTYQNCKYRNTVLPENINCHEESPNG